MTDDPEVPEDEAPKGNVVPPEGVEEAPDDGSDDDIEDDEGDTQEPVDAGIEGDEE